jgi:hypothetical protein
VNRSAFLWLKLPTPVNRQRIHCQTKKAGSRMTLPDTASSRSFNFDFDYEAFLPKKTLHHL